MLGVKLVLRVAVYGQFGPADHPDDEYSTPCCTDI